MKAAVVGDKGLEIRDVPEPEVAPNEVKIRVRACGVNRADLMVAAGMAHGRAGGAGTIVGIEYVGEVVEVGAEAFGVKPGDRVMCTGGSGWAEYATADCGRAVPLPANNMSWTQAATLPIALQTMHNALVTNGRLAKGDAVMIQGASSGVGLMGLQIAKAMGARFVVGSSTNAERRAKLSGFGADLAVDSRDEGWVKQVLDATGGKGVDLIVDQISGYVANQNMEAAAIQGRIVNVGRLGGFTGEFNFDLHAMRRIHYIGVTFRTRSVEEVRAVVKAMREDLWEAVEEGRLTLPIDSEYALDDAAEAAEYARANRHFGKVVLTVDA